LLVISVLTALAVFGIQPKIRGASALDVLIRVPIAIPSTVLGLGLIWAYFRAPVPIYGTLGIMIIAATTKMLPLIYGSVGAAYVQLGPELREAGLVSGARRWKVALQLELPILAKPLGAIFLYGLILSAQETTASLIVYSPSTGTLPVLLFHTLGTVGATTTASVISIVSMLLMGAIVLAGWILLRVISAVRSSSPARDVGIRGIRIEAGS